MKKETTRRRFISRFGHIVGLGVGVSVVGEVFACTRGLMDSCPGGVANNDACEEGVLISLDYCPGGHSNVDVCDTDGRSGDECPGEGHEADHCPSGSRDADQCNLSSQDKDVCHGGGGSADQCSSGKFVDDICVSGQNSDDKCPNGQASLDTCSLTGGIDEDLCLGGGESTNDETQDTCAENGDGDQCDPATQGNGDACDPQKHPDTCGGISGINNWKDDDVCYTGIDNNIGANGGDDNCGIFASDTCLTGKPDQDSCKELDICHDGSKEDDVCNENSDDYCNFSIVNSDKCIETDRVDEDECLKHIDKCIETYNESDGCSMGVSFDDACASGTVDTCNPLVAGSDVPE